MPLALEVQLSRLRKGDHLCSYYETTAEQIAIVTTYIRQGLARRERCLYIADDQALNAAIDALEEAGVDVDGERARGALLLQTPHDTHLSSGRFDCDAMLGRLNDALERSLNDGFSGLRTADDMAWILEEAPGMDKAAEYEALLNEFYPDNHALGLCLYQRVQIPAPALDDALKTHPRVLLGSHLLGNPYYEPPDVYFNRSRRSPERERFDLRIGHLPPDERAPAFGSQHLAFRDLV